MATRQEILDSLNVDLGKEHGAIVQYVLHAAQLRDSVLSRSQLEVSREEMWHMEWLTEAIKERGGTPTLGRAHVLVYEAIEPSLQADVDAEEGALEHYEKTLATIGDSDEELTRLVERIMDDERHHRTSFTRMAEEVGSAGDEGFKARAVVSPTDAHEAMPMIGLEYEGLLQYLWNKYFCGDCEQAETYFEIAVNEMRHLWWVGSCMGGLGEPQVPAVPTVVTPASRADALERATSYEQHAAQVIERSAEAVPAEPLDPELKRIDVQHAFHRFQLARMRERTAAPS